MDIRLEGVPMWLFLLSALVGLLCTCSVFCAVVWLAYALWHDARDREREQHKEGEQAAGAERQQEETPSERFWRQQLNDLSLEP